jgi:hypothetical protein
MAALLAAGHGAALSHTAAAAVHGLMTVRSVIDVKAPTQRRGNERLRMRTGGGQTTVVRGLRVTTVAQTLLDQSRGPAAYPKRLGTALPPMGEQLDGVPHPAMNDKIDALTVDVHWPASDLVIELDADQTHGSPWAKRRDERRDAYLRRRGKTVRRIRKETFNPPGVERMLRSLLG